MKNDVIIGLGSNINPVENIKSAIQIIKTRFSEITVSPIIKTAPLGFKDQADFYNGAIRFKTVLSADTLKKYLVSLEDKFGRVRTSNKNGPRTIDLDILTWNEEIIDQDVYDRYFLQKSIEALASGLLKGRISKR